MYYGLTVNLPQWPEDVGLLWQTALRPHGLLVERAAECHPAAHAHSRLVFRLRVEPGSFPAAARYGRRSIRAGFSAGFQVLGHRDLTRLAIECPAHARALYRRCPYEAHFSTDRGRTVADVRLQCFAAAALAAAAGGVMHDGRSRAVCVGAEAWRHAAGEAERYEALASSPGDWALDLCDDGLAATDVGGAAPSAW